MSNFRTEADDARFLKDSIKKIIDTNKLDIVRAQKAINMMEGTIEKLQNILDTLERLNTHHT